MTMGSQSFKQPDRQGQEYEPHRQSENDRICRADSQEDQTDRQTDRQTDKLTNEMSNEVRRTFHSVSFLYTAPSEVVLCC